LITAKYAGVEVAVPKFELGKDNKTEAFLAKNPNGKLPVLDTPQGPLFESNAIARYLARLRPDAALYGSSFYESALVDQWIEFSTNELEPARSVWLYTVSGALPSQNPKPLQEAKKDVENALRILDQHFLTHTYLVGNTVTLADITIFTALLDLYAKVLAPVIQNKFANLFRWLNTIGHQTHVASVVGQLVFATEEAQPTKLTKAAFAPAAQKPAAIAGAAAPKPAAKPATKPADDEDDDDKPKPKPKSALDELPPSPMVLDTMKKLAFSKRPMLPDFFEQFWPQFDAAGYSWYVFHYKYNSENTVFFKTGNLVGGFVQRSDAARKYSMGVINVYGNKDEETPPFKVSGAWLFRGPGISAEMTEENPDCEYYEWKKMDCSSEKDRQLIKDQFMAENLDNEPILDRRYFK